MAEYIERQDVIDLVDKGYLVSNTNYGSVSRIVRQIPSADVAPVRHGRWIEHHDTRFGRKLNDCIECNCCKVWFSAEEMIRRSYCPNCGAKMDGGDSDER